MSPEGDYLAERFAGETGGERIQAALTRAADERGQRVVTVAGAGPDDGVWETTGLEIGSHTTLLIRNATIKLADGAGSNVLRNIDLDTGNDGISVIGVGDATIDGNAPKQPRETDGHGYNDKRPEWIGLRFEHCDGLTIRNLRIERTTAWAIKSEHADRFEAANLHFEQDDTYINQDGIHVCGPASRVTIRNLTGETWDDTAVLNVGGAVDAYGPLHGGGPIEHVSIRNIHVGGHRPVRAFTERGRSLHDVEISDVSTWGPVTNNAVELNATYADEIPSPGDVRDIRIRNVRGEDCEQVINLDSPATDLRIDGVTARNVSDAAVHFGRPMGAVSVRGVDHRTDPMAVTDADAGDSGTEHPETATIRWTGEPVDGDFVIRDIVARESGSTDSGHTVAAAETAEAGLAVTIDGVDARGTDRLFALGDARTELRNVSTQCERSS